MLSNIDDTFLLGLKTEMNSNSSSTFNSSELLPSYSPIETMSSELTCLTNLPQGKNSISYVLFQ